MFFDPHNRRGRGPWGPVPTQPRPPVARNPFAQDPYARDPYGRDPYARDPRDPYARDPRDPFARDPRAFEPGAPDGEPLEPERVEPPATVVPPSAPAPVPTGPAPDKAQLAGALRELEAAKARVERDAKQVADDTRKKLVAELLPVVDNLDRTIHAAAASGDAPAVIEGIRLVRAQLEGVLRGYGVERIDATGAPFDPAIHDAITQIAVTDPAAHRTVVDQIEPGYRYGDKLLRPAKVVVGAFRAAA